MQHNKSKVSFQHDIKENGGGSEFKNDIFVEEKT
jgi:hypothetical protein